MAHALAHIGRVLHSTPQLLFCRKIEFAQQALFPAIPQRFIGGTDIRNGQANQIAQTGFALHFGAELLNNGGILDIAPLCRDRHQQMAAH